MRWRGRLAFSVKRVAAWLLYVSGILPAWIAWRYRGRAVVLMYHRVLTETAQSESWSHPRIIVTRETFEAHVSVLRRFFRTLTLDEFVEHVEQGKPFTRPSCLITFDDGWSDTYTNAWPVLRDAGMSAVVFLPVDFIDTGRLFWQEQVSRDLSEIRLASRSDAGFAERARTVLKPFGFAPVLDASDDDARPLIAHLTRASKYQSPSDITAMTEAVAGLRCSPRPGSTAVDGFMNWRQVGEMAASGIAFGGHGSRHMILTTMDSNAARSDVVGSIDELRTRLGRMPLAFSYPNGDWSPDVAAHVRATGVRVAFATGRPPFATPFALRRLNIQQDATATGPMLLARIAGLY